VLKQYGVDLVLALMASSDGWDTPIVTRCAWFSSIKAYNVILIKIYCVYSFRDDLLKLHQEVARETAQGLLSNA